MFYFDRYPETELLRLKLGTYLCWVIEIRGHSKYSLFGLFSYI